MHTALVLYMTLVIYFAVIATFNTLEEHNWEFMT